MRLLLFEAAQIERELRRDYQLWEFRPASATARVIIERKLVGRLPWMPRQAAQPFAACSHAG